MSDDASAEHVAIWIAVVLSCRHYAMFLPNIWREITDNKKIAGLWDHLQSRCTCATFAPDSHREGELMG